MKSTHRQFLYHREEDPRIFEKDEHIPEGWFDSPDFKNATPMWFDKKEKAEDGEEKPLRLMNKGELMEYAIKHDVEVDEAMTKQKIIHAIIDAESMPEPEAEPEERPKFEPIDWR